MKTRIRKVPATTANLTTAIVNFLLTKGHFAFRVNNGAVYDPVKKCYRTPKRDAPAISDVLCIMDKTGVMMAIEIKNLTTGDRLRQSQIKFRNNIMKRGGYHVFVYTYEQFLEYYIVNFSNE